MYLYSKKKKYTFLNHAATSPLPAVVSEAIINAVRQFQTPLSLHFYEALSLIESTRELIATQLSVSSTELAFCNNTSTALSLIAQSIRWRQGDIVLAPSDEFNSNLFVWQNLATKGVTLRTFTPIPGESIDITLSRENLKNVRLISISAVSYQSGRLYELQAFANFCKANNILSCLDAIQALGACKLNLQKAEVDFAAFGAQKWLLGPIGCGFLFTRKKILSQLDTPFIGWTSARYSERLASRQLELNDELSRLEPGLPNIFPIAGLNAALKHFHSIGFDAIYKKIAHNRHFLEKNLASLPSLRVASDLGAGIYSCFLSQTQAGAIQNQLAKHNIIATVRPLTEDQVKQDRTHFLRLSPHYYHESVDLIKTAEVVLQAAQKHSKNLHPPPITTLKNPHNTSRSSKPKGITQADEQNQTRWPPLAQPTVALLGYLPTTETKLEGSVSGALAEKLLSSGYRVVFVGRMKTKNPDKMTLAEIMKTLFPNDFTSIKCVVTDMFLYDDPRSRSNSSYEALVKEIGTVDHYINCLHSPCIERAQLLSPAELHHQWQLHVGFIQSFAIALYNSRKSTDSVRARVPSLSIIMQTLYLCPMPYCSIYHASWQALYGFARSISLEWRKQMRVRVIITSAAHSKLQKRRGRTLLRFFRFQNNFSSYTSCERIAEQMLKIMQSPNQKKCIYISIKDRLFLALVTLFPMRFERSLTRAKTS